MAAHAGENTADNGGMHIAVAHRKQTGRRSEAGSSRKKASRRSSASSGFAQVWCENGTPESARLLVKTDPHSPGEYRVNWDGAEQPGFC